MKEFIISLNQSVFCVFFAKSTFRLQHEPAGGQRATLYCVNTCALIKNENDATHNPSFKPQHL